MEEMKEALKGIEERIGTSLTTATLQNFKAKVCGNNMVDWIHLSYFS